MDGVEEAQSIAHEIQALEGGDTCAELSKALEKAPWKWSKSFENVAPHWYVLQTTHQNLFKTTQETIKKHGKLEVFSIYGKKLFVNYLYLGEYKYWTTGNVLNRARIKDSYEKDGIFYPNLFKSAHP